MQSNLSRWLQRILLLIVIVLYPSWSCFAQYEHIKIEEIGVIPKEISILLVLLIGYLLIRLIRRFRKKKDKV